MRLERLHICGFKSFSDRAELCFDDGVTAIVGPNGCGKSNVADAITWVLGEQSAKSLRGDRMEDVIFSGSDARKAGATAEVRLRLTGLPAPAKDGVRDLVEFHPPAGSTNGNGNRPANGNGNGNGNIAATIADAAAAEASLPLIATRDVEVTRRLYRSGESEYLIDGQVCRLRDVHELLMDTGLGAKAYAIIEQGKIGMILSSRPADRRQLIEEAAGITKYKSRRRAAELKLEASQQNLTRIDDIVFEVEKQRGALKRQAAKARRYKRLRDELRRWEKVLFARRYRELAQRIEEARARLADARIRDTAAAARVAEVEGDLARLRIEQAEADSRAARTREEAHARELDINRRQQELQLQRHQADTLAARAGEITGELQELEARRDPVQIALESRRQAATEAERARDEAERVLGEANQAHAAFQQQIDRFEGDVETGRGDVFAALNAATALRHAMDHAVVQRDRIGETLAKLAIEQDDVRREAAAVERERLMAVDALADTRGTLERLKVELASRELQLNAAREAHEAQLRTLRASEQEVAALAARLASLEEVAASRAAFGDAARMVLVQANGRVGQQGAVADYVDVDRRYERAVEACLGDLLQHVIVERHEHAAAGLELVREHDAGRCGFVVIDRDSNGYYPRGTVQLPGVVPLSEVLRVAGPHAATIHKVLPEAYFADSFDRAVAMSRQTAAPVATLDGDVLRGPHVISGGAKAESRGILATKREIRELRERVGLERERLARLADETGALEITIAQATSAVAALIAEQHRLEMSIVGHEAQVARAAEEAARLARKDEVIALECRRAEGERATLDARCAETEASIQRLHGEQQLAEERLAQAQQRLAEARGTVDALSARAAEARAAHAAMLERSSALVADVLRLEEGARELEQRISTRAAELDQARVRREALLNALLEGERTLDDHIGVLETLRRDLCASDEHAAAVRAQVDAQDGVIRQARHALDQIRAEAAAFDLARAAAEGDLGHLAQTCVDTTQTLLDDVVSEVERLEQTGEATPDAAAIVAEDPESDGEDADAPAAAGDSTLAAMAAGEPPPSMTAEEAIVALRAKVDHLGPVNMMAIEQFDELEARHAFLTTQRKDLVDSIAQTVEAIKRIDETSKSRFQEAFSAIQENFQITFSTLFGGGRAGLTLLDDSDPLESGIDIVASPPGKRLQSVQLLSGGEKALTAIALMFAIFRYKPSPFCLLDEIDAPLDDANVGRFVEMLRGMLDRTQFILITHNRRTMEIANRLYGVTMEEPGVSKLISVQLN